MKPITLELQPTEGLTLLGILAAYVKERESKGLATPVSKRLYEKVDKALLDATEPEK